MPAIMLVISNAIDVTVLLQLSSLLPQASLCLASCSSPFYVTVLSALGSASCESEEDMAGGCCL